MAEAFRRKQLPIKQLFDTSGLSMKALAHSDTRYPQDGVTLLWKAAAKESACDHIGLEVGRQMSVAGYPVLGHSLITAIGLVDGFQRFQRYQKMIGESANIQLAWNEEQPLLSFHFSGDKIPVSYHSIDAAMAALVSMARVMKGEQWRPKSICLKRPKPQSRLSFEQYYQCPVIFEAQHDGLYLEAEDISVEIAEAQLHSDGINEPALLASLKAGSPIVELVEMLIKPKLQDGVVNREWLCECLSITPRTLQRRLAKEGESYQRIMDRVREQLALEHLANPKVSQNEVAFLCGFSDLAAFHHAFKRWRKQTPGEYREAKNRQ